jgi:hypothetical protein
MELWQTYLILCPAAFIGGAINSVAGGGTLDYVSRIDAGDRKYSQEPRSSPTRRTQWPSVPERSRDPGAIAAN